MTVISMFIIFFKWQASPRRNDTSWCVEKKLLSQKGGVRHTQRVFYGCSDSWYHAPWEISGEDSPHGEGPVQEWIRALRWLNGRTQRPGIKHKFPREPGHGVWAELKQGLGFAQKHLDQDFPALSPQHLSTDWHSMNRVTGQVSGETAAHSMLILESHKVCSKNSERSFSSEIDWIWFNSIFSKPVELFILF